MKRKIFIILILTLIGFSLFTGYIIFSNLKLILHDSISARANNTREGFSYLISQEKLRISNTTIDYANWTDMGERGVRRKDKNWLRENLDPWIRRNFGYELVILVKSNGEIISKGISPDVPIKELISTDGTIKSGFYLSDNKVIIYSSSGVFDNSGENFYNAYLILGKIIDEKMLLNWKNIIQADIVLSAGNTIYSTNPSINIAKIEDYGYKGGYIVVKVPIIENAIEIASFYLYKYDSALHNVYRTFLISTFLSISLSLLVAIMLLRFFIARIFVPLDILKNRVESFKEGKYDLIIDIRGDEEIRDLAKSFKELISKITERESELESAKLRAQQISYTDELTSIPNRRYMEEYISQLINSKKEFSIVFLDLDGFKKVNDILGHQRGDELLHNIAKWFKKNLREEDMVVSRYGGDEFCLIFVGADKERAEYILQRLYKNFHEEDFFKEEIPISFSYGIASYPKDGSSMYELLNLADKRMYQMKQNKS